MIFMMHEFVTY